MTHVVSITFNSHTGTPCPEAVGAGYVRLFNAQLQTLVSVRGTQDTKIIETQQFLQRFFCCFFSRRMRLRGLKVLLYKLLYIYICI